METKLPGTIWDNNGLWNWRVTVDGKRKNFSIISPTRKGTIPVSHPKSEAESAAWLMWRKLSKETAAEKMPERHTVDSLCAAYSVAAHIYYRNRAGKETSEANNVEWGLMLYRKMYGDRTISSLTHADLVAVRKAAVAEGYARTTVNKVVSIWKRMMTWALDEGMIAAREKAELSQVSPLKAFRSEARETEPVTAAKHYAVKAVCTLLPQNLADMIRVQELTGMRPGEVAGLKWEDVEKRPDVWLFRPEEHKNSYRGLPRVIVIGPMAQRILAKYEGVDGLLFSPKKAMEERYIQMREARKSPVPPSQRDRSCPEAQRKPSDSWQTSAYGKAVRTACELAKQKGMIAEEDFFAPNMLRHACATRIRRWFGANYARTVLGHSLGSARITDRYSWESVEAEFIRTAVPVMRRMG